MKVATILFLGLASALVSSAGAAGSKAVFRKVEVGLFAAYLPEYQSLLGLLSGPKRNYTSGGRLFTTGKIGNKNVAITMCGIGMTNAAMTTQAMIYLFRPKYIIMSGIAGGMDPSVRIGDVVVPKFYLNPQLQKFIRPLFENGQPTSYFLDSVINFPDKYHSEPGRSAGSFGLTLPGYDSCGRRDPSPGTLAAANNTAGNTVSRYMAIPLEVELLVKTSDTFLTPTPPTKFYLPASKTIIKVAQQVVSKVQLARSVGNSSLPYQPSARVVERGMSTNTFLDNADYRKDIFALYQPTCVEMEGHAVLQTCISNKVKCAVVRSISDLAGGEPGQEGENELGVFFGVAAINTGRVASAIIKALP